MHHAKSIQFQTYTMYVCNLHTVWRKILAGRRFSEFALFKCLAEKLWQMNRSAKGLLIVTIY